MANKYAEYFDIDKEFFRCIDQEAIRKSPELWQKTFPHPTFITLLKRAARMLDGSKEPIWIHGSYGTGKSQCAWALKKILEVPEAELREYWERFSVLQTNANTDLLEKLIGHKNRKIVTAYRYASGGIKGTRDLLCAVQDSVKNALEEANVAYKGENTLKDSVIEWLQDPLNNRHFNEYLELPEFSTLFSQSTADEVIAELKKGGDLKELMDNIFHLSDKRSITAFDLNTDRLIEWIKDVINKNDIKIVLIWDEFSSFFTNNRGSLDEFQKIASLAQSTPFYFCVVTHQTSSIITNSQDEAWKVVRQRYEHGFVEITLPDSIAFDIIGTDGAMQIKDAAKSEWLTIADNLYAEVPDSSKAVIEQIKKTETNSHISADVFKKIMPLHPFAAMVLKYIATAFEANQRSMFDFIKTADNEDVKAFQWFISETAQDDERPLLTVDLLWNFFYENGRKNLTADIQSILDTFPRQKNLSEKEQSVLKTILIIQAIDQRTSGQYELFRLINRNLSLAFEGVSELSGNAAVSVANKLVQEGILFKRKIGNNVEVYNVVGLAGDQSKIENHKKELREKTTTAKLVELGGLQSVITLKSALKLRYDVDNPFGKENVPGKLIAVTAADFNKTLSQLKTKGQGWRFIAVLAFAKNNDEVTAFRKAIKEAVVNENYNHIIFIDALSTPLGNDEFEQYVDFQSMSMYYAGNDNELARKYAKDAKGVLEGDTKDVLDGNGWFNRIQNGTFIVYTANNPDGESYFNKQGVAGVLESVVLTKFPLIMDFNKGITETMLSHGTKDSVKCGINQISKGRIVKIETFTLDIQPNSVWNVVNYWEQPRLSCLPISKIKIALDEMIGTAFESRNGQISIREIYDKLEDDYGFAPSNLTAFLIGFLLKEYCCDEYRFIDSTGKPLDAEDKADTMAGMVSDYIGNSNLAKYKDTYIARMTLDEKAFYDLSEKVFDLLPNSCATVGVAALEISKKIGGMGLPIWALQLVDQNGVYDVVEKYISLIQKEGAEAQAIAIEIGKVAGVKTRLGNDLKALITKENCQQGIREFLKTFEDGKILDLAYSINAEANVIDDIRRLFSVERSRLWIKATGEIEIRKLITEYGIASETNALLSVNATSLKTALVAWRDKLKFIHISSETAKAKYANIAKLIDFLTRIYSQTEILPDGLKAFFMELQINGSHLAAFIGDEKALFAEVYELYLDDFTTEDVAEIISRLPHSMFAMSASECNIKVKDKAEEYRKGQLKVKLFNFWRERTGTKNPKEWSTIYKCPILAMVDGKNYDVAKRTFDTINQSNPPEFAIKDALDFLNAWTLFDDLKSEDKRDKAFVKHVIGSYAKMLTIQKAKDKLERLTIDAYDWLSHPQVKIEIKRLAEYEYNAGGSDRALAILERMKPAERDEYIIRLIKENVSVGLEIIMRGGN